MAGTEGVVGASVDSLCFGSRCFGPFTVWHFCRRSLNFVESSLYSGAVARGGEDQRRVGDDDAAKTLP